MSTATAEPPQKTELPPLEQAWKAELDKVKARTEPAPEPAKAAEPAKETKPEAKAPEAKQPEKTEPKAKETKAEEKAPEKPAEKPAEKQPEKKGKKSVVDSLLSEETATTYAETGEVEKLISAENPNWAAARETMRKQVEEIKALKESSQKAAEPPPELTAKIKTYESELQALRSENARMKDAITTLDVRYDPTTQDKLQARDRNVNAIAERIAQNGGDKDLFLSAMEMPSAKRAKALDQAMEGIESDRERATINTKLGLIETMDEEIDSLLSNPHQTAEQLKQQREIRAREEAQRIEEFKQAVFDKTRGQLPKLSRFMREAPADAEGAQEFNAALKADQDRAMSLLTAAPEEAAVHAYKAARYDSLEKFAFDQIKAYQTELSEVRTTLSKYEGGELKHNGDKTPPKREDHEVPLEKAWRDALESKRATV